MLSARGRFAVPEKILKRSSCTSSWLHALDRQSIQGDAIKATANSATWPRKNELAHEDAERIEQKRQAQLKAQSEPDAYTDRAKLSRKRRSGRSETQQRLGAPTLGSGKLQTPPNRYPPAWPLSLLLEATPSSVLPVEGDAGKRAAQSRSRGRLPAC